MKVRKLLSGFLAAIITVLVVVSLADGYANYDKEPPKVVYTDPQDEAKNVDPQVIGQTGIRIRFGEPVVVSHAAVTVDGLDLGWILVDSGYPYEALLKKGKKNLPHDAKIDVKWCVQDYAGNQAKGTFSFTTGPDTEPPYLVWSDPEDGEQDVKWETIIEDGMKFEFDKPVLYCYGTITFFPTGESYPFEGYSDGVDGDDDIDADVDWGGHREVDYPAYGVHVDGIDKDPDGLLGRFTLTFYFCATLKDDEDEE